MRLLELLTPLTEMEFNSEYFEKSPFLSKNNDYCGKLFWLNNDWVQKKIKENKFSSPIVDMADGSSRLERLKYTHSLNIGGEKVPIIDTKKLTYLYNKKNISIILQGVEQWNEKLAKCTSYLSCQCQGYLGANIYCTPVKAKTFPRHYDTHDVFILQTQGSKRWKIWNPTYKNPRQGEKIESSIKGSPDYTFFLEEGDSLYIPRGFLHEAEKTSCISIHLTLGLMIPTMSDVLDFLAVQDSGYFLRAGVLAGSNYNSNNLNALNELNSYFSEISSDDFKKAVFMTSLQKFGIQKGLWEPLAPAKKRRRKITMKTKLNISLNKFKIFYSGHENTLVIASLDGVLEFQGDISLKLKKILIDSPYREIVAGPDIPIGKWHSTLEKLRALGVLIQD